MRKIYLACPYSHPEESVRLERFELANKAAGKLMQMGYIVFSPISHSHPISYAIDPKTGSSPEHNCLNHDFWLKQDRAFVEWCDILVVFMLDGWEDSFGVSQEIEWVKQHEKHIAYLTKDFKWKSIA